MTDSEISKALALAIGWTENRRDKNGCLDPDVAVFGFSGSPYADKVKVWTGEKWQAFNYRDPAVIWPIAEKYNLFPYALRDKNGAFTGRWNVLSRGLDHATDSPAKSVALAVIGRNK